MWQTRLTMTNDNQQDVEYIEKRLQSGQNLTFAKTYTKNNVIFSVACAENLEKNAKKVIENIARDMILVFYKLRYILHFLNISKDMNSDMCIFISALLFFDFESEKDDLGVILANMQEYSLDGLYYFGIKDIKQNWAEECAMAQDLLSSDFERKDLLNISQFLQSARSKKASLFLADCDEMLITNATKGGIIEIKQLFNNRLNNLIGAVIENSAAEIIMERANAKKDIVDVLRSFVKVKLL
ncbi:MAG: hypothetical protein RSB10_04845 [Clostridia bacterium]